MAFLTHLITVFMLCSVCFSGQPLAGSTTELPPPSQDPFYLRPQGFEKAKPGTILRHRLSPAPLAKYNGQPSNVKATYQLLYRSTNSIGNPEVAVTTIVVPEDADPTKLLSFQSAYDSADNDCSPSYQFLQGAAANTTGSVDELGFIAHLLSRGWIVNIPDYEGLLAAYSAGVGAGFATLDSVRAALRSSQFTGIDSQARLAMWGYSGGSFASNWASELQPSYAPELRFVGTAAGGLTPNLTSVFLTINDSPAAGLAIAGILGLAKAYFNLSEYLDTHLVKSTASAFRMGNHECFMQDGRQYANQNLSDYFVDGEQFLTRPVPSSVVNIAGILGRHGPPAMPLYLYKAVHDEISPIADTDKLVQEYCAQGVDVQYIRIHKGDHEEVAVSGLSGAMTFLEHVMSGGEVKKGCNTTNTNA